ncbi:helix-turn-helix transcriptional regulator [Kribbella sp. NPDC026611]|uniref:helix-turn-helix domain-containing protein n=1 Tax=Kribbella sp. NPDC026611 TaxID=3154911 RepID=UPI003407242F
MSDTPAQTPLGDALRSERRRRRLSLRDLADEIGVSFNTLSRVERGHVPDLKNYDRIVAWLGGPGQTLLDPAAQSDSTPEVIAKHLYSDARLKPEHATQILSLLEEMYDRLAMPQPAFGVHLRSGQTFLPEAGSKLAGVLEDMHTALLKEQR